jgi:hypothetical protein
MAFLIESSLMMLSSVNLTNAPKIAVLVTLIPISSAAIFVASTVQILASGRAFFKLLIPSDSGLSVLTITSPPFFSPAATSTCPSRVGSWTTTTSGSYTYVFT